MKNSQIDKPLVSVIIPNYNHARYLDQRIQSVLNQTYRNIEVIILDDCSTDNSIEVINKYKEDSRIKQIVVNEHNSGNTFLQWDKGIHLATGEWIWIAESDDYCELNFLEELVNVLQPETQTVVVACNSEWVNGDGESIWRFSNLEDSVTIYSGNEFIVKKMAYDNDIPNASAAIFHRETALSISKDYTTYLAAGDRLFWIHMSENGDVIRVNQFLNHFRQHNDKVSPRRELDGTVFFEDRRIIDYIIGIGILRGLDKQRSFLHFQSRAFEKHYLSEQIRAEVYKTWNCSGQLGLIGFKARRKIISIIDKVKMKWLSL